MTPWVTTVRLAIALLAASTGLAVAADLTQDDYRLLQSQYGLQRDNDVLARMSAGDRQRLHDLISGLSGAPARRDESVRNYLYESYTRECDAWSRDHGTGTCPPAKDPAIEPGKDVADRLCNECHLFGSGMAPSFRRLAQQRNWDGGTVANALGHSHDMVPITLPAEERDQLARYINSFR